MTKVMNIIALVVSLSLLYLSITPALAADTNLHLGKAGFYMRCSEAEQDDAALRAVALSNPLLDCIVLGTHWSDLEPEQGKFQMAGLRQRIQEWTKTGKHVMIQVVLYGQSPGDRMTPAWLWRKKGVRAITFAGGGMAKGAPVTIPAVWDKDFVNTYSKPLVAALAKEFDGDQRIWYIHPGIGHIGHLSAQPSKDGAGALRKAGWTPELWKDYAMRTEAMYRQHFKKTPLLVGSSPLLIRDRANDDYVDEGLKICTSFGKRGDSVLLLGLGADRRSLSKIYSTANLIAPEATRGQCRLGMGDDWPLWVPEQRRKQPPTVGFDDAFLQSCLNNALNTGKEKLPTTIIYFCPPEILASSPLSPGLMKGKNKSCYFRQEVQAIMQTAHEKLMENDAHCFGKPVQKVRSKPGGV